MLTAIQKKAVNTAKRYKKKNYQTEPFRQQYFICCSDGYVKPERFLAYVNETPTVYEIPQEVKPTMQIEEFFDCVIGQAMRTNRMDGNSTNGKTNQS